MNQIVPLQVIVLLIISVVCALFFGLPGFLSALAGGFSYILPTLVAVFTFKVFPTKSQPAKFDVCRRRGFKSSAVAGIYVGRFCDMASIAGIFPIFVGVSWRQSFGFFSIVESETLWQVKL